MTKYECSHDFKGNKAEINAWKLEYCFKVKPLNNIPYPGMQISGMTILEPEFAKNVIQRKIERKIDLYLAFLASQDDDSDNTEASFVLDDLIKFKETILIRYSKFLSKSELAKVLKEVSFVESKLKIKAYTYDAQIGFGKSR